MKEALRQQMASAQAYGIARISHVFAFDLVVQYDGGLLPLAKVATAMGTSKVAAGNAISLLKRKNLVLRMRDDTDTRCICAPLTERGRELARMLGASASTEP